MLIEKFTVQSFIINNSKYDIVFGNNLTRGLKNKYGLLLSTVIVDVKAFAVPGHFCRRLSKPVVFGLCDVDGAQHLGHHPAHTNDKMKAA